MAVGGASRDDFGREFVEADQFPVLGELIAAGAAGLVGSMGIRAQGIWIFICLWRIGFWIRIGGGLPGGDGDSFDGVGSEAIEKAADGAEASLSGGDSHAKARVFRLPGHVPEGRHLLVLMLKAVGGDLTGQMRFLLLGDLGLRREDLAEPLDDAADNLADAGL